MENEETPVLNKFWNNTLFWILVIVQTACMQAFTWTWLPIYGRLLKGHAGATRENLFTAIAMILLLQATYWSAVHLQHRIEFKKNIIVGHLFLWFGDICLFFIQCLVAVAVFERFQRYVSGDWNWTFIILVFMLFASYCYKRQLKTIGRSMMKDKY